MKEENEYKRLASSSLFALYKGLDGEGRHSILAKLNSNVNIQKKTKFLDSRIARRKDGKWALTISLTDDNLLGVFSKLIDDLESTIEGVTNEIVAERYFIQRYKDWQLLFERAANEILDIPHLIGLFGELTFINTFMIPKFGATEAIKSWVGPIGADKDFYIESTWFEVKTKSINKNTIHVNNKNQLTPDDPGFLIVVNYEKSTSSSSRSSNLIKLYNEIIGVLDGEQKHKFLAKLANIGFVPKKDYENFNYIVQDIDKYSVNNLFPQIDGKIIPTAICNIEYDIYLPEIKELRVND